MSLLLIIIKAKEDTLLYTSKTCFLYQNTINIELFS